MNLSIIISQVGSLESLAQYLEQVYLIASQKVEKLEFVVVSTASCPIALPYDAKFIRLEDDSDIQKLSICGIDNAKYDNVLLLNSFYSPQIVSNMIDEKQKGAEIVCVKPKMSKIKKLSYAIIRAIYNFILSFYGDGLFSMGIAKDMQLLSGEILMIMKENQSQAYRLRTMYAPNVYNTSFIEYDLPQMAPLFNIKPIIFASIISLLIAFAFVGLIIAFILLNSPFIAYFLAGFGFILIEFISVSIVVQKLAKINIGGIYKTYRNGKIYKIIE